MSREDFRVSLSTIKSVSDGDKYWVINKDDGWSFQYPKSEYPDFEPKAGDWIVTSEAINTIAGIVIEGRVIRNKTAADVKADHEKWVADYQAEKLKRFVEHGDELKARVKKLPLPLEQRMNRFAAQDGDEFWIESAEYEMAALEGAAALIRKAEEVFPSDLDVDQRVKWVEDWWALNTKEGGYNYKKQMEIVPDFGDGHSGNTAGAAYVFALRVIKGDDV